MSTTGQSLSKLMDPKSWKSHLFGFPQNQWKSFEGQSYWVTGGGTGYGQAIAVTLAAAGAQVFLTGRRADKLQETIAEIRSLGIATENIHAVPADITDTEAVQAAIKKIESLCDGLDGVVNNAALPSTPGNDSPLRKDPKEHWERMLATNVTGAWDLTRNILDHLIKSGRPRVLFIGSGAGWAGTAGVGPYNVSKAAQNSLCQSLAAEFARDLPEHDVQVNTLVAGEARTEMNQGSDVSPYVIVRMALLLLTQDRGGPNGCFFSAEGDHLSCGESAPHGEPLMEVKKEYDGPVTSRLEVQQLKRACLHQFFTYDDGDDDNRYLEAFATCLPELHKFLAQSPGGELAIYGAGKLTDYFLRKHPAAVKLVNCIIDDDPAKWETTLHGLPVVALEDLPEAVENVLVTSTKAEILFKMQAALKAHREELNHFDFSVAAQLMPGAIPARAWQNHEYSIYPVEIPEVKFEKDRDLLLLEMPPRYMPFLPYGIGCVHEIIKGKTDLNFETMDLNIMWYHRYHMARILDGVQKTDWPEGDQIDPWESTVAESWDNAEIPSEYQANDDAESKRTNRAVAYFREQLDELIDAIVEARPRMLGFSLNLNNTVMVHEVIKGVRKRLPDVLVLVGGYAFYSHKLSLARNSELYDYVVVSEGEYSLPPLIKKLQESFETGEMPKDLPGILSRFDSPDRKWGAMPNVSDLSNHAFPRYDWLPYNFYRTYGNNHTVPTCTSRGCSWSRCKFCCECANYYNRKPEEFVNELEWHVKQGAHTFNLFESDINGDHDNLQNIMREIVRRGLKINIYGQFRIDRRNTPEFFRDLKAAGFSMVRFGVDGWTDNSLKKQCKSCNMKIVEQNLKDATEAGLLCNVNMVLGVPGETEQDVEESYQNIVRLKPYINMFETLNMLRVACGSEYFENPDKFKIRFREDRDEIYKKHKVMLPENLWYSEDPYIDDEVRVQRFRRIVRGCHEGGVVLGDYIKWSVVQEVNRIEGTNETDFETVIYAEPKKKRDSNGEVELSTINNFGLQGDELEATAVEEEEPAAEGCGKDDCCQIETDETAEPATNGSCCGSEEPIEEPVVEAESEAEPEPQPEIAEAPMAEMKQRADGLWYANGDEAPFSGRAIAWYAVDRMQIEITLRDGSMDGPHRTWHENGQAEVETTFVQGTEHGRHVEFYDNGQVKWESVYEGGEIISLKGWREDGEQRELPQWERDGTPKLLVAAPTE